MNRVTEKRSMLHLDIIHSPSAHEGCLQPFSAITAAFIFKPGKVFTGIMVIAAFFICPVPPSSAVTTLPSVESLYHQSREKGAYLHPDHAQLKQAEDLFSRMLHGERGAPIKQDWQKIGFHLTEAQLNDQNVLVLYEDRRKRQGRGFYLFPVQPAGSSLMMVPHRFYDLHTGSIGLKMFAAGSFSAAAWSTVHRHKKVRSDDIFTNNGNSLPNWDLADLKESYFTALTRAFSTIFSKGHILQLHGFSKEKRKSWAGRDSDIVLSNGTRTPPDDLINFADCLKMKVGAMTRVYPLDVRDLGATENVSARIMETLGHPGFIQMEMCLPLRQQLLDSPELNTIFTNCMQESWR